MELYTTNPNLLTCNRSSAPTLLIQQAKETKTVTPGVERIPWSRVHERPPMQNPPLWKKNRLTQLLTDQGLFVKPESLPIHCNVTSPNQQTKITITPITPIAPTPPSLNHHDHTVDPLLNEKIFIEHNIPPLDEQWQTALSSTSSETKLIFRWALHYMNTRDKNKKYQQTVDQMLLSIISYAAKKAGKQVMRTFVRSIDNNSQLNETDFNKKMHVINQQVSRIRKEYKEKKLLREFDKIKSINPVFDAMFQKCIPPNTSEIEITKANRASLAAGWRKSAKNILDKPTSALTHKHITIVKNLIERSDSGQLFTKRITDHGLTPQLQDILLRAVTFFCFFFFCFLCVWHDQKILIMPLDWSHHVYKSCQTAFFYFFYVFLIATDRT